MESQCWQGSLEQRQSLLKLLGGVEVEDPQVLLDFVDDGSGLVLQLMRGLQRLLHELLVLGGLLEALIDQSNVLEVGDIGETLLSGEGFLKGERLQPQLQDPIVLLLVEVDVAEVVQNLEVFPSLGLILVFQYLERPAEEGSGLLKLVLLQEQLSNFLVDLCHLQRLDICLLEDLEQLGEVIDSFGVVLPQVVLIAEVAVDDLLVSVIAFGQVAKRGLCLFQRREDAVRLAVLLAGGDDVEHDFYELDAVLAVDPPHELRRLLQLLSSLLEPARVVGHLEPLDQHLELLQNSLLVRRLVVFVLEGGKTEARPGSQRLLQEDSQAFIDQRKMVEQFD